MHQTKLVRLAASLALLAAVFVAVLMVSSPAALAGAFARLNVATVTVVLLCLVAGLGLSALRLKMIAADLGYSLSTRDATIALSVGQLAGNLFFQLAGQLIGRGAVLARRGIPPAASVVISGYERIFALSISLGLAICGATYLFGKIQLDLQAGGLALLKLAVGVAIVAATAWAIAWGSRAARFCAS